MSNLYDFSGIWITKYQYHSDSRDQDFEDTHYVRIYQKRNHLVVESLPEVNDSYLIVNLTVNDNLATGTWEETMSPTGYYKGTTYNGVIQLRINKSKKVMSGKWLGAVKGDEIKSGPFEFTYVGKNLPVDAKKAESSVKV